MPAPSRILTALAVTSVLFAGCSSEDPEDSAGAPAPSSPTSTPPPSDEPSPSTSVEPTEPEAEPAATPRPVSVLGLAAERHRGDRLPLGAVRERTAAYTSYDVTYRSRSTTATEAARRPTRSAVSSTCRRGRGPFPAVVLAHGYIDPAVYVRGQGMTRERGYLAARGYVALHVDYRNHAESDDDPRYQTRMRLGYSADVINAVKALRASRDVPVDDDRVALFGRSMGGGVILKALVAEPGLVQAAAPWASVSSLEAENYRQFIAETRGRRGARRLVRRHGTPGTEPALLAAELLAALLRPDHRAGADGARPLRRHLPAARGRRATQRALLRAGVDSQLEWYDDGHAFGPAFNAAMDRTIRFLNRPPGLRVRQSGQTVPRGRTRPAPTSRSANSPYSWATSTSE